MKKFCIIITILFIASLFIPQYTISALTPPDITAGNAIVIDLERDVACYEKQPDQKIDPNVAYKIVTALVILDKEHDINRVITVPAGRYDKNSANIVAGEDLKVKDLLVALLILSSNEAANALVDFYMEGDRAKFIELMNEKAAALGCKNTSFASYLGNDTSMSYSTVRDISVICKNAVKNENFVAFANETYYQIDQTNKSAARGFYTTNQTVVGTSIYRINGAVAIKNHYTQHTNHSLATMFVRNGRKLLCVVFGSTVTKKDGKDFNNAYEDTRLLFEYASNAFKSVNIIKANQPVCNVSVAMGKKTDTVVVSTCTDLNALMPVDYDAAKLEQRTEVPFKVSAPVEKDQILGRLVYVYDGAEIGSVELKANNTVDLNMLSYYTSKMNAFFTNPLVLAVSIIVVMLFVMYIVLVIRHNVKKRRERMYKSNLRPRSRRR